MVQRDAGRRGVVVTGVGCVSPIGVDAPATWLAAVAGRSGAAPIRSFDATSCPVRIAAECAAVPPPEGVPRRDIRHLDRVVTLALTAAQEAVRDAKLTPGSVDGERLGVALGTGIGGVGTLFESHRALLERGPRRVSPFAIPMSLANMPSGYLAIRFGARGPNMTVAGACASGAQAIGEAARAIERGDADAIIAGGAEAVINPLVVTGFAAMRALSTRNDDPARASRPFDIDRDGFLIGEGAGILILEGADTAARRGARPRGEVLGYGVSADATHIALPDEDGAGARLAMSRALADAELRPDDVDCVNAHATSTPAGDVAEARALRELFGAHIERLPVSGTKSMTGHMLGAAGAVEAILCVRAMEERLLPPTVNLDRPDPACTLDHVASKARPWEARVALSNSFGFGGLNISLLLGRSD